MLSSSIKTIAAICLLSSVAINAQDTNTTTVLPTECTDEEVTELGEAAGGSQYFAECLVAVARVSEAAVDGQIDSVAFQDVCTNTGCSNVNLLTLDVPDCSAAVPSLNGVEQRNIPVLALFTAIDQECQNGTLIASVNGTEITDDGNSTETDSSSSSSAASSTASVTGTTLMLLTATTLFNHFA